jgi:1-acyl-sn-glycerol-3-phosphate acyltransferase
MDESMGVKTCQINPPAKSGIFDLKSTIGPYFFKFTQKILLIFSYIFLYLFTTIKIKGRLPKKFPRGGLLVIANHKGFFDPLLLGIALPFFSNKYPLRFMAKDDFFQYFWSYLFIKVLFGSYPSYYGSGMEKSLEIPKKILSRGGTVVLFPEGKRFLEKGVAPLKPGAGILAESFPNTPILPVSLYGNYNVFKRIITFHRPKISINIGDIFTLSDEKLRHPSATPTDIFTEKITSLYEEII